MQSSYNHNVVIVRHFLPLLNWASVGHPATIHLDVLLPGGAVLFGAALFVSEGAVADHGHEETKVKIPAAGM